jgi:cysteine desulfurase
MGSGAACHSGTTTPSRVLAAMGVDPAIGAATLRLTLGASTRERDVDIAVTRIAAAARSVRDAGVTGGR